MLRPGIVLLDADTLGDISYFQLTRVGNLTVYQSTTPEQRIDRICGKEIVITNKVVIDKKVIQACPSLKLICIAATGMNNVDVDYAKEKGVIVRNVAGYSTESVVQHTFAMLFYLMGSISYYDQYVQQGNYTMGELFTHHGRPFHEIAGKKYGIIGMGTIGKRIAVVARSFLAEILAFSTTGNNLNTGYRQVSLQELLAESDIISIHCPLNDRTQNLIGYDELRNMKRNAMLINAGRGGIVNENDLAMALNEGLIAGAALDVMTKEPPEATNPLLNLKHPERLLITPHIAWASIESRERLVEGIVSNIEAFLHQT